MDEYTFTELSCELLFSATLKRVLSRTNPIRSEVYRIVISDAAKASMAVACKLSFHDTDISSDNHVALCEPTSL